MSLRDDSSLRRRYLIETALSAITRKRRDQSPHVADDPRARRLEKYITTSREAVSVETIRSGDLEARTGEAEGSIAISVGETKLEIQPIDRAVAYFADAPTEATYAIVSGNQIHAYIGSKGFIAQ